MGALLAPFGSWEGEPVVAMGALLAPFGSWEGEPVVAMAGALGGWVAAGEPVAALGAPVALASFGSWVGEPVVGVVGVLFALFALFAQAHEVGQSPGQTTRDLRRSPYGKVSRSEWP